MTPVALRTRVNGVTFADGYPRNLADLQPRCERGPVDLALVREHDNAHDLNAIKVELEGRTLGRIPADVALFIAPQLDQGITWTARAMYVAVDEEHPDRPGLEIELTKEN